MSPPQVVSRDRWLEARKELLAEEKRLTRARELAGRPSCLPGLNGRAP